MGDFESLKNAILHNVFVVCLLINNPHNSPFRAFMLLTVGGKVLRSVN